MSDAMVHVQAEPDSNDEDLQRMQEVYEAELHNTKATILEVRFSATSMSSTCELARGSGRIGCSFQVILSSSDSKIK